MTPRTVLWISLGALQITALISSLSRYSRVMPRGNPRIVLPLLLLTALIALIAFAAVALRLRRDPAARPRVRRWGVRLVTGSAVWAALGLTAILAETESMAIGLFALLGIFFGGPAFLVGAALVAMAEPGRFPDRET